MALPTPIPSRPVRRSILATTVVALALGVLPAGAASAASQIPASAPVVVTDPVGVPSATLTGPAAVLAATAWETTGALDQDGAAVPLTDPAVSGAVGWAYYKTDGTFTIYNLDDTPRLRGDWSVAPDGSTRTLVAKDATGAVLFTRVVPIITLTAAEFTYRLFPDAADTTRYFDIVHTPTAHPEPGTVVSPVPPTEGGVVAPQPEVVPADPAPVTATGTTEELAETGSESASVIGMLLAGVLAAAGASALFVRRRLSGAKA